VSDIKEEKPDQVMADEELDHVFGGMTGTYVCAAKLQSSVVQ
jgi:hypothetical protein